MKVRFWGVRGSFPVASPDCLRYGGNTPCVEVETGGDALIIDAGSGIRQAGKSLLKRQIDRIHLLLSHTHWDHIQGLPHFAPLYRPQSHITVYGLQRRQTDLGQVLRGQQQPPFVAPPLTDTQAQLEFVELEEGRPHSINGARVTCHRLNHPSVTGGYRIEENGAVLSYISDADLYGERLHCGELEDSAQKRRPAWLRRLRQSACDLAHRTNLMVCDTFFLPEEYKPDFGHSRPDDALRLAMETDAQRIALFHHAPHYDDDTIDRMVARYRPQAPPQVQLTAAREGMEISL